MEKVRDLFFMNNPAYERGEFEPFSESDFSSVFCV